MQSRWLKLYAQHVATSLETRHRLESSLPDCQVELTVRGCFGVLTTPDYDSAYRFCVRAGALPHVLEVVEIDHATACARWL